MALGPISKLATGITGLDAVMHGGFPAGRPVLLCGAPGAGKTLLAMQFIAEGVLHDQGGVFVSFEESADDLRQNVLSIGLDLAPHEAEGRLKLVRIDLDAGAVLDVGQWSLDPILIRLGAACDAVRAKRLALDGIDALFGVLHDRESLRFEFTRLLRWARDRGLSVVVSAERGHDSLTRHGLEEYLTDCVISLDHRLDGQVATRQLRIVKYRGSAHGANEYPFLIGDQGLAVFPVTSAGLDHRVSTERISTGVAALDAMFGGHGVYRGSTVLLTGSGGTGKSTLAARMVEAAAARKERTLYLAMEEAPDQIVRNMGSVGIDLRSPQTEGLLRIVASRPSSAGLESHLVEFLRLVEAFNPLNVVIDPVSAFSNSTREGNVRAMLVRLIDSLKSRGITTVMTALTEQAENLESTAVGISSLVDTWISLRNIEFGGERTRALYILKSRGMAHSNQVREFRISHGGLELLEVDIDPQGVVLTGSRRRFATITARAETALRELEAERQRDALDRKRQAMDVRIAAMKAELEEEIQTMEDGLRREEAIIDAERQRRSLLATERGEVS